MSSSSHHSAESGRGVLVTGASRGIGRAIATAFAQAGDRVAVHCSSRPEDAARTLDSLPGSGHVLVRADLADPGQVQRLVGEAVDGLGALDVLVNNAAVMTPHPPATTSYADWQAAWRSTVEVNLLGAANLSHQVAAHLIERGATGRIVNVGSRGAFRGEPDHPAYAASKAALHALGQSLAVALAPHGIAVVSVAPGFVETERVAGRLAGQQGADIRAQSPFGRVAAPEEVASAVLYLASPEATWSSGAVLDVNGASHLRT
ncbi:SDR family NAD(P)-dependent oxidoreductase [Saccharopolyspora gregorii]|uniref:SDR family NAD(P)-dependent oxidoreductase n=1 Tax=Saccharopolyspora gregorii TaxID=33914 RepID=UPI0021ABE925|nr:SDR family oxidoreductase [Saccharopolyspora gregorii]